MKLRIKGNSLRLRLGPSEIAGLLAMGRVEETIRFALDEAASLTYALELVNGDRPVSLRYAPCAVTVLLSRAQASEWAEGSQIAIAGDIDVGSGALAILIEKDFACIDRADREEDTFPNPKASAVC